MVSFPSSLDSLTNPAPTDFLATSGVEHDLQHATMNDILEALEAKVGIDGSAVASSLDRQMEVHAHTGTTDDGGIVDHANLANVVSGQHAPQFVGARVKKSSNQSTVGEGTVISFDQEDFDTDTIHDTSTNNSRLTVPTGKGGKWLFIGQIASDITAISWGAFIRLNGSTEIAMVNDDAAATGTTKIVDAVHTFSQGDYLEMVAKSSSGTYTVLSARTFFTGVWLG